MSAWNILRLSVKGVVLGLSVCMAATAFAGYPQAPTGLWAVPTYQSIGVYWRIKFRGPAALEYRLPGKAWQKAQPLYYDTVSEPEMTGQYRGSIVNLRPGTTYEVRVRRTKDNSWTRLQPAVTTWRATSDPAFPVRTTIVLPPELDYLETSEAGDETGWVVYDGGPNGTVIDGGGARQDCVAIRHGKVVLRGVTVRNCTHTGICINRSAAPNCATAGSGFAPSDVVIENVDISRFGQPETSDAFLATCGHLAGEIGRGIGIHIRNPDTERVVVQHSRIRAPLVRSLHWRECTFRNGHPHGPFAIHVNKPATGNWRGNHVFRFNTIESAPDWPFEDLINGPNDGRLGGAPGADTDIYGNVLRHAADDGIEADGGGINVRIWGNYFDLTRASISFAPLSVGPAYVFRNVFERARVGPPPYPDPTEFNNPGPVLKAGTTGNGPDVFRGPLYVFHNTSAIVGDEAPKMVLFVNKANLPQITLRNNIWMTSQFYLRDERLDPDYDFLPSSTFDYDMHNMPAEGDSGTPGPNTIQAEVRWAPGHGPTDPPGSAPSGRYEVERVAAPDSAWNRGVALSNFNRAGQDLDGAPDMDAHEAGSAPMRFGVGASWDYRP